MVLIDTSVWIDVFRDAHGQRRATLLAALEDEELVLCRFIQLELLQGCRDEREWGLLSSYLATQDYLEMSAASWQAAARIYFDLRRAGQTVRSPIDCCLAQLALTHEALLLHRDRDFSIIAEHRPLRQRWLEW